MGRDKNILWQAVYLNSQSSSWYIKEQLGASLDLQDMKTQP